jgi:iron complex transport system substrate-binding protein
MTFLLIPVIRRAVLALAFAPFFLLVPFILALAPVSVLAQPVQVTDARGITLRLTRPAQHIVALAPNLTELAFAAGAGDRLAGVARHSDFPPAARGLPVISDAVQFDLERMLVLRTDLVLAWQGGTPPDVIARMERAGMPVFVAGAAGLDDISRNIMAIAQLAGTTVAGAAARAAFDADLRLLRSRRHEGPPVRVFYEIWDRPLMTVNQAHLISEIITLCGGSNVFGDLRALTPEISREALLAARPDIVLGGSSADSPAVFAARWAALPQPFNTWPARHLSPDLMQRPTPRILEGARQVCAHLDGIRAARR